MNLRSRSRAILLALACQLACSNERPIDPSERALEKEADFWAAIEIDGNWVEFYPTLAKMSEGADLVLVGTLDSIESGPVVQGDAVEDVVVSAVVTARPSEAIRGPAELNSVDLELILPRVFTVKDLEPAIDGLREALPTGPVLLLLRYRDGQPYRVVSGYGLWAQTLRSAIDAPLNPYPPDEGIFGEELRDFDSFDDLVDAVRP